MAQYVMIETFFSENGKIQQKSSEKRAGNGPERPKFGILHRTFSDIFVYFTECQQYKYNQDWFKFVL